MVITTVCKNDKEDTGFVPPRDATIGSEGAARGVVHCCIRGGTNDVFSKPLLQTYGNNCFVTLYLIFARGEIINNNSSVLSFVYREIAFLWLHLLFIISLNLHFLFPKAQIHADFCLLIYVGLTRISFVDNIHLKCIRALGSKNVG